MQSTQSWISAIIEIEDMKERGIKPTSTGIPEIGCASNHEIAANNEFVAAVLRGIPKIRLDGKHAKFGKELNELHRNVFACYQRRADHLREGQKMDPDSDEYRIHHKTTHGMDTASVPRLMRDSSELKVPTMETKAAMALLQAIERATQPTMVVAPQLMKEFLGIVLQAHRLSGNPAFNWSDFHQFVPQQADPEEHAHAA